MANRNIKVTVREAELIDLAWLGSSTIEFNSDDVDEEQNQAFIGPFIGTYAACRKCMHK